MELAPFLPIWSQQYGADWLVIVFLVWTKFTVYWVPFWVFDRNVSESYMQHGMPACIFMHMRELYNVIFISNQFVEHHVYLFLQSFQSVNQPSVISAMDYLYNGLTFDLGNKTVKEGMHYYDWKKTLKLVQLQGLVSKCWVEQKIEACKEGKFCILMF